MIPAPEKRQLFGTMNIAAYVVWLVLVVLALDFAPRYFLRSRWEALACLAAFLAIFLAKQYCETRRDAGARFWVLLTLEGMVALLTCVVWSPHSVSPILTIVFMVECGLVMNGLMLAAVMIAVNAGLWIISSLVWGIGSPWRILLTYAAFQLFALLTAWYAKQADQTAQQLRETNAHLLATRSLLEESARDHERLRLARELHDVAGHKLTALKLNLTALQREAGSPNVDTAAQLATELLADIRGVVAQIRQHDGLDIRDALTQLIKPLPAPPQIHLVVSEDARVASVAQAETLLRVVQEALTNVIRHANARNAWVELQREGDQIFLRVRDDGQAALPLSEGFGLAGMRERLAQIFRQLRISHATQGGVALDIQLPLDS